MAATKVPQRAGYPLTLKIETARLPKPSWVKLGQTRTLSTERLGRLLGHLAPAELDRVIDGVVELMG